MVTQPTKLPSWATGGSAEITEPPDSTKANGWLQGMKPPHEFFNYWQNLVYEWLAYFKRTVGAWTDLGTAYTSITTGDMALVWEDDSGSRGVELIEKTTSTAPGGGNYYNVDIDIAGDHVLWFVSGVNPRATLRDLVGMESAGTPTVTYTRTHTGAESGGPAGIRSNGLRTVIINGRWIECFNATTGASLWEYDTATGNVAVDLCIVGNRVYVAGGFAGGFEVLAINLTTGVLVWGYNHGAAVSSICSDGERIFIAGGAGTGGAHARALNASGEDTTTPDLSGVAWDRILDNVVTQTGVIACDGTYLFVGFVAAATHQIVCVDQGSGLTVWNVDDPETATMAVTSISVDKDYVYVTLTDTTTTPDTGWVEARVKSNGHLVWRYRPLGEADSTVAAAVSDGQALYEVSGSLARIRKVSRGNVPTRYRRVDVQNTNTRYRANPMQPEAQ